MSELTSPFTLEQLLILQQALYEYVFAGIAQPEIRIIGDILETLQDWEEVANE